MKYKTTMTTKNCPAHSRLQGKKHLKLSLFACVLTAGVLTACSSEDENTVNPEPQAPRLITVQVSETPMEEEGAEAREGETRGDFITTGTLSGFTMHGISGDERVNYKVTKSDNDWSIKTNLWPNVGNNVLVDFYAYTPAYGDDDEGDYPYPFDYNSGNPYVNFTMSEDAFHQHDLLIAQATAKYSYNENNPPGVVNLQFHHVCSAVKFTAKITDALKNKLGNNTLTVKHIKLRNVYNSGKYSYSKGWYDVNYLKDNNNNILESVYTLTNSDISFTETGQTVNLPCNYIFVIPQTREEDGTKGVYLEVSYSIGTTTSGTAEIPFGVNWKAGYEYTINILLGTKYIKYEKEIRSSQPYCIHVSSTSARCL